MNTYKGFETDELEKVFIAVRDPQDWRAEIDGWCYGEEVSIITAAIQYYTATTPTFTLRIIPNSGALKYAYHADGYRKGPAGDH